MKVTVDIDCTPEEARRFMGLPDMAPAHDLYMDRIKDMIAGKVTPGNVEDMLRQWSPVGDAGLKLMQSLFAGATATANATGTAPHEAGKSKSSDS